MFVKYFLAGFGITLIAMPALSDEFYIVQDAATKRCTIAAQPPVQGGGIIVGDGAYANRAGAEADMKTIYACMPQSAGSGESEKKE